MGEVFEKIQQAVISMKVDEAVKLIEQALKDGKKPIEVLNQGLIPSLKIVGEKFKRDEIFLPEVMLSARAFKSGFEILKPLLLAGDYTPKARVAIGTVAGDVHDIGKNIVGALLEGNGYQVIDLGINVAAGKFVDAVRNETPEIIGMSTLLTTTMPEMEKVIKGLEAAGVRGSVKVIVGGAPVTKEFADKIKADGFGADAQHGVEVINSWVEKK
jgi:corrinoid protein of di/trimethylamine methyltransferase